jgi:hypothetical protein
MVLGESGDCVTELVSQPRLLRDLGKNFRRRLIGSRDPIKLKMPNSIADSFVLLLGVSVAAMARGRQVRGFVERVISLKNSVRQTDSLAKGVTPNTDPPTSVIRTAEGAGSLFWRFSLAGSNRSEGPP